MTDVVIIDSGGANIMSLSCALERLGVRAELTRNADDIRRAGHVLLPGVGAAKDAMARLFEANLVEVIRDLTQPVLGICLGMQLLCERSEEDHVECLGIIPGIARKLQVADSYPVPNMGWCATDCTRSHPVMNGVDNGSHFYYVHSYALSVTEHTIATARHTDTFAAAISKDNFVAAQFHPERSSSSGARILSNFLQWAV